MPSRIGICQPIAAADQQLLLALMAQRPLADRAGQDIEQSCVQVNLPRSMAARELPGTGCNCASSAACLGLGKDRPRPAGTSASGQPMPGILLHPSRSSAPAVHRRSQVHRRGSDGDPERRAPRRRARRRATAQRSAADCRFRPQRERAGRQEWRQRHGAAPPASASSRWPSSRMLKDCGRASAAPAGKRPSPLITTAST